MSRASDIARRLAADFAELASQLEEEYLETKTDIDALRSKTDRDEQTLRDVATLILERLN